MVIEEFLFLVLHFNLDQVIVFIIIVVQSQNLGSLLVCSRVVLREALLHRLNVVLLPQCFIVILIFEEVWMSTLVLRTLNDLDYLSVNVACPQVFEDLVLHELSAHLSRLLLFLIVLNGYDGVA